jgi:hypothetical protein
MTLCIYISGLFVDAKRFREHVVQGAFPQCKCSYNAFDHHEHIQPGAQGGQEILLLRLADF